MSKDPHSHRALNLGSPSSDREIVEKIIREFLSEPGTLALDVGGTKAGFIAQLPAISPNLRERIFLVNPEGDDEIAWRSISLVPNESQYDLVMMFGTAMYFSRKELTETLEKVLSVLRPGGTFLVADLSGTHPLTVVDLGLKIIARMFPRWRAFPWRVYPKWYTMSALRSVGFVNVHGRPDLRAYAGWRWMFRIFFPVIVPSRYYVVSAAKASTVGSGQSTPSVGFVVANSPQGFSLARRP